MTSDPIRLMITVVLLGLCAFGSSAQDYALQQLENSPRHHEWVQVRQGERNVHCFVAYPEKAENAVAVIVIHENRGLTDWVRSFADQLAEAGYIAIAPDLLSGFDAEHDKTSDFETSDAARNAIYQLNADQVMADLLAVQAHIAKDPACNGKTAVAGFCWGGAQSFRMATASGSLSAALVFYGSPPDPEQLAKIACPVYGFYGGEDQRINATIPATKDGMEQHGKTYDVEIYDGAGHAYMRRGDDPAEQGNANDKARDESWERINAVLGTIRSAE